MAAPYRVVTRSGGLREVSRSSTDDLADYLGRLMQMIPAEVVSLYLVGSGLIPDDSDAVLVVWSIVCLIGLVALRLYGTADPEENKPPQWGAVLIAACAFVIWLYALGGPFAAYDFHVAYVGSLLILAWTFFLPIFYKGEVVTS